MNGLIKKMKELNSYEPMRTDKLTRAELWFLLFFTGSVIGWIYELIFYLVVEDRLTKGWFFFGPYLPIYGFGTLFIILTTKWLKKYPVAVFLITIPVTGILEYATGYVMYEIWEKRWWDYTNLFLNIDGYVCFRSVITFAIGAVFLIYLIEPLVRFLCDKISPQKLHIVCGGIIALLIIDAVFTVLFRMPPIA